jgi:hypothetical protein
MRAARASASRTRARASASLRREERASRRRRRLAQRGSASGCVSSSSTLSSPSASLLARDRPHVLTPTFVPPSRPSACAGQGRVLRRRVICGRIVLCRVVVGRRAFGRVERGGGERRQALLQEQEGRQVGLVDKEGQGQGCRPAGQEGPEAQGGLVGRGRQAPCERAAEPVGRARGTQVARRVGNRGGGGRQAQGWRKGRQDGAEGGASSSFPSASCAYEEADLPPACFQKPPKPAFSEEEDEPSPPKKKKRTVVRALSALPFPPALGS